MKKTLKVLTWLWILSLFMSPIVGLYSILALSCVELGTNINWDATFTGKPLNKGKNLNC